MNLKNTLYLLTPIMLLILFSCNKNSNKTINNTFFTKEYIIEIMEKSCDWQLANLDSIGRFAIGVTEPVPDNGWVRGSFFTGVMATYNTTGQERFLNAAINLGKKNNWEPGERPRHADDHCIIQTYAKVYFETKVDSVIEPSEQLFDSISKLPYLSKNVGWGHDRNWSWSDALFMAPPAWAMMAKATGKEDYLDVMDAMWWDTYNHLYDDSEDLFYRDDRYKVRENFEARMTSNGKKVFWGRGNGWVLGGLVRLLDYLPEDYPTRGKYESVFKKMSAKLIELQGEDGLWRSSLIDFEEFPSPESSSTGFFCYGLAWGINNGLLDEQTYLPAVKKAWNGLNWAMNDNGKLGYVQLIGHDPKEVTKHDNMEYGTGAFLLAGSEMYKLTTNK